MRHSFSIALLAALALTGCAVPLPVIEAPPVAPTVQAVQPAAAPEEHAPVVPAPAIDPASHSEPQAGDGTSAGSSGGSSGGGPRFGGGSSAPPAPTGSAGGTVTITPGTVAHTGSESIQLSN